MSGLSGIGRSGWGPWAGGLPNDPPDKARPPKASVTGSRTSARKPAPPPPEPPDPPKRAEQRPAAPKSRTKDAKPPAPDSDGGPPPARSEGAGTRGPGADTPKRRHRNAQQVEPPPGPPPVKSPEELRNEQRAARAELDAPPPAPVAGRPQNSPADPENGDRQPPVDQEAQRRFSIAERFWNGRSAFVTKDGRQWDVGRFDPVNGSVHLSRETGEVDRVDEARKRELAAGQQQLEAAKRAVAERAAANAQAERAAEAERRRLEVDYYREARLHVDEQGRLSEVEVDGDTLTFTRRPDELRRFEQPTIDADGATRSALVTQGSQQQGQELVSYARRDETVHDEAGELVGSSASVWSDISEYRDAPKAGASGARDGATQAAAAAAAGPGTPASGQPPVPADPAVDRAPSGASAAAAPSAAAGTVMRAPLMLATPGGRLSTSSTNREATYDAQGELVKTSEGASESSSDGSSSATTTEVAFRAGKPVAVSEHVSDTTSPEVQDDGSLVQRSESRRQTMHAHGVPLESGADGSFINGETEHERQETVSRRSGDSIQYLQRAGSGTGNAARWTDWRMGEGRVEPDPAAEAAGPSSQAQGAALPPAAEPSEEDYLLADAAGSLVKPGERPTAATLQSGGADTIDPEGVPTEHVAHRPSSRNPDRTVKMPISWGGLDAFVRREPLHAGGGDPSAGGAALRGAAPDRPQGDVPGRSEVVADVAPLLVAMPVLQGMPSAKDIESEMRYQMSGGSVLRYPGHDGATGEAGVIRLSGEEHYDLKGRDGWRIVDARRGQLTLEHDNDRRTVSEAEFLRDNTALLKDVAIRMPAGDGEAAASWGYQRLEDGMVRMAHGSRTSGRVRHASMEDVLRATEIVVDNAPSRGASAAPTLMEGHATASQWRPTRTELFGATGAPRSEDVAQGGAGDCYLLASLAAVAQQRPEVIEKMVRENDDGTVTVRVRDRKITLTPDVTDTYASDERASWVPLVEKAYAVVGYTDSQLPSTVERVGRSIFSGSDYDRQGYEGLGSGGYGDQSLAAITGSETHSAGVGDGFDHIRELVAGGKPVVVSSQGSPADEAGEDGVVSGHLYAVRAVVGEGPDARLELYNPWGTAHLPAVDEQFLRENFDTYSWAE